MEFLNKLLTETDFLEKLNKLEQLEQDRIFCRHGLNHILDVARVVWIYSLEQGLLFDKEQIYLTAFLHDIGRVEEYEKGITHHAASVIEAEKLLSFIGYPKEKKETILTIIGGHREKKEGYPVEDKLEQIVRWADKKSRNCFFCQEKKNCKWPADMKNETIEI